MSRTQAFTVQYIAANGSRQRLSMTAASAEAARALAIEQGVSGPRITRITEGFSLAEQWRQLRAPQTSDIDRMLIYTQMGALVASGSPISQIEELVRTLLPDAPAMDDSTVSAWLRNMGFPDMELAVIEASESAGRLADGLNDASEQLTLQIKIKKETGKQFSMAMIVFAMAAVSLLMMPMTTGGTLEMIEKQLANPRMSINTTFLTDVLLWQRDLYKAIPGLPLLFPLAIGGLGWWQWKKLLKTALFRPIDNMQRAALSIRFLLSWRPLYRAGTPVRSAMERAGRVLPEALAKKLMETINRGGSLSSALVETQDQWSRTLVMGLRSADNIVGADKMALMDKLILALSMEQSTQAAKAARVLYLAAALLGVGTIFVQLLGAMLPMMTLNLA